MAETVFSTTEFRRYATDRVEAVIKTVFANELENYFFCGFGAIALLCFSVGSFKCRMNFIAKDGGGGTVFWVVRNEAETTCIFSELAFQCLMPSLAQMIKELGVDENLVLDIMKDFWGEAPS